jgi:transposase
MPRSNKRQHTAAFKAKVALELLRREGELTQVCAQYQIHPTQARRWRRQAMEGLELLFSAKRDDELKQRNELIEELYKQIGQLKVEHDWLKKISQAPV